MIKTPAGEAAVIVSSFLLCLSQHAVGDIAHFLLDNTPPSHCPIKPRRVQVSNVIDAVESQTAGVSWTEEINITEEAVGEVSSVRLLALETLLQQSCYDIPARRLASFYQALCTVCRFPDTYRCSLQTSSSIVTPYALAYSICGLRVCVVVKGETIHGSHTDGKWQVLLERSEGDEECLETKAKLGRVVGDLHDLLVLETEPGLRRANRIDVDGIGQACTLMRGLALGESEEIAVMAIATAMSALSKLKKGLSSESTGEAGSENLSGLATISSVAEIPAYSTTSASIDESRYYKLGSTVDSRLLREHTEVWWGVEGEAACRLSRLAQSDLDMGRQPDDTSWMDLNFGEAIGKSIERYQSAWDEMRRRRMSRTGMALSRKDSAELL